MASTFGRWHLVLVRSGVVDEASARFHKLRRKEDKLRLASRGPDEEEGARIAQPLDAAERWRDARAGGKEDHVVVAAREREGAHEGPLHPSWPPRRPPHEVRERLGPVSRGHNEHCAALALGIKGRLGLRHSARPVGLHVVVAAVSVASGAC
eukprot:6214093-Pleurochrysis_carterae.AAC.5